MITEISIPRGNIIPQPWLMPPRRKGRRAVFDRHFQGSFDRSDLQFNLCEVAVIGFLQKLDVRALRFLAQELRSGHHNEWTNTSDVAAILARLWQTERGLVIKQYDLVHLNDCTYWFAQAAGRPDCPFIEITLEWIEKIISGH